MYGLTDEIHELRDEVKDLKGQLHDVKVLAKLLLDNPNNEAVKSAVKIALNKIEE